MCESITILISLFRSKNVCNLADSFCVPVLEPLRLVEVIVIWLADFLLKGFVLLFQWGPKLIGQGCVSTVVEFAGV